MSWQLVKLNGEIAGVAIADWLTAGFDLPEDQPPAPAESAGDADDGLLSPEWLRSRLDTRLATWLILPSTEQSRREHWQAALADLPVQVSFGRAGLALALSALRTHDRPTRLMAADQIDGRQWLSLTLAPGKQGVTIQHSAMDGRLAGHNDLTSLLAQAQMAEPTIEVLVCPDYPRDAGLERLMPFLASLTSWSRPELRWEFPEQLLPPCGVVGAIWGLYWLLDGYRLGDWHRPGALLSLDEHSPLAGVTVVAPVQGSGAPAFGPAALDAPALGDATQDDEAAEAARYG
ncbi:hypothetical protein [Marinobacter xestospongiae]|uniref:hypothetical protein n=1 Tax=Marinobacter xestospongiae TaxID=994319 RepID=UPI002002E298|nr:hypothetical protein [Marinobacter xestospongiae]MCK7567147.1 hypothetical protein [Marinobacter xestospongiae]